MDTDDIPRLELGADAEDVLYDACVASAVAPMHCEPRIASQMVSQQVAGQIVAVFEEEGEWLRVRGVDDYEAWMHRGFVAKVPTGGARRSGTASLVSLGCTTRDGAGMRRALPLRALLAPSERCIEGEAIPSSAIPSRFPLDGVAIAATASDRFRGTSYLWGGVTPWGADCSGLVQCVFALHGKQLPRDAWQQAELGTQVDSIEQSVSGDLLFFSDRPDLRITHVGIALGASRMVHLSLGRGGFAIESFDLADDPYTAKLRERYLFSRRLIGAD